MSHELAVRVCPRHNQVLEEGKGGHLICPGPQRHRVQRWNVVNTRTERALYQASMDKGTEALLNDTTKVGEKPQAKSKTIEREKFQDGVGQTLWLRITLEPKKYGGDPYRLRWAQHDGKKTTQGVAKTCPDAASGKRAFAAAVAEATRDGWKQVPSGTWGGARTLTLKPIPKPKKRA